MPDIAVLVRSHFQTLKGATAQNVGANAWEIRIPTDPAVLRVARRGARAEDWDGAVFLIDDRQSEPALGSGEGPKEIRVTAWVLDP